MTKGHKQTHEDRERVFANIFGTVRADGQGTGMGSTDKERDATLAHVTFDKIPDKVPEYKVPEVPKPKVQHASLMDDLAKEREGHQGTGKPLHMDEKTKTFYAIFDHVTDGQAAQYGGQAFQPETKATFTDLPSKAPKQDLPEVLPKAPERDFLKEDMEARAQNQRPPGKMSERYKAAHDAYVNIFGDQITKE